MPTFSVYTLGCKLNQAETEAIASSFKKAGWTLLPWNQVDDADDTSRDILIINTCTVTSMAEQKARRVIRQVLRDTSARVIVTGCYAQLEEKAIAALAGDADRGRLLVIPGSRKGSIADLPAQWLKGQAVSGLPPGGLSGDPSDLWNPEDFSFHSRPFIKIEDGCDRRCSFCRVSLARGKSRSLEAEKALGIIKALEEKGAAEAVLTGVNLNQYRDTPLGLDLAGLLGYLLEGSSRINLRLSSLEPEGLTGDLLKVLAHRRIRPHFHLSVQSGSAVILEQMRRPYGPEAVEQAVAALRSIKDDPFLAADIIAGFPGETEEEFEKTLALCRRVGFAWIHAFPYSPRQGTEAFHFKNPVAEREAGKRVEALLALARQGREAYIRRWMGRETEAVFETGRFPGFAPALSANYLKLLVRLPAEFPPGPPLAAEALPGRPFRCRLRPFPPEEGPPPTGFDAAAEFLPNS
ncbi:tRNA (N(6)-L-threonylcarbamoyladenosine(37)-C(2))-methylthiotransferase MtaB [Spirochaetia bacterium]|nr:tRNA (N(6)-L-threonylcarbamoyladenosine(37)-C(2))-methylthiotransferase MtaB [Spirochaetia bacterium]